MRFDKIKGIIGGLAPTLGTALGGPLGGAAANVIAEVLGCDPNPVKIERAIAQATPEQIAQIKKAELNFEARMKELDVDVFAIEAQDRANARSSFSEDWTARSIALLSIILFGGYVFVVTLDPPADDGVVNLVLGYLGGIVSAVVSFYFGASQQKGEK